VLRARSRAELTFMSIKGRVGWSLLVIGIYLVLSVAYNAFGPAIEAGAAVNQVHNSITDDMYGRLMARGTLIPNVIFYVALFAMFVIWLPGVVRAIRGSKAAAVLFIAGAIVFNAACGAYKLIPLETVGPNETAFVIPMEGDTTQQEKFESVDFLQKHKVMSKRIEIPVRSRSTGRMWWSYEWIPTVRVIKVDRSLVTREWTNEIDGNNKKSEALSVASLDGVNFHLGVNLTATILEEDAAKYLYFHGQKPLSEVVDSNVRGFLQGFVADEFGRLSIEECKKQKADLFARANTAAIARFKEAGISLSYVGSAQGFQYDDPAIQRKINETQTAEMAVQIAAKKVQEQIELNKAVVSKAVADRQAAEQFAMAASAQKEKLLLDIELTKAQAQYLAAQRWDGKAPASILPQGTNMMFGLDGTIIKK
jgi:hypothetical protein